MEMLTQSRLKELLHYDPETGVFTWLLRTSNRIRVGGVAGCARRDGYRLIRLDGGSYLAHRLAWLYIHGVSPPEETDHINGIRADNRIANLREATKSGNQQNRAIHSKNTSGFPGVSWHSQVGKWQAHIRSEGKSKYLGLFDASEDAHEAYCAAKVQMHRFNPTVRAQ